MSSYYYTNLDGKLLYISAINLNRSIEVSLYQEDKLLKRNSFYHGTHLITHGDFELHLYFKLIKDKITLLHDGQELNLNKVKRKELKALLMQKGYYNDINPRSKAKDQFNPKILIAPICFILFGIALHYLTINRARFWFIPVAICYGIAYWILFSPLVEKIPDRHLDDETRGKAKFILALLPAMLTQDIVRNFII